MFRIGMGMRTTDTAGATRSMVFLDVYYLTDDDWNRLTDDDDNRLTV